MHNMPAVNYIKAIFTGFLAIYGILCARSGASFLDRVNLIAHEAGHLLFGYMGQFIGICGGTIGQLLVPAAIAFYFYARREFYSAAVVVFWFGQNMFNISAYVKDASAMALPLVSIGGGDAIHDWNYLLRTLHILNWDQAIGNVIYGLGILIILVSVVLGFWLSFDREEPIDSADA